MPAPFTKLLRRMGLGESVGSKAEGMGTRTARASQLASINALTRWTWKHFSPKVWPRCGSGFPRRKNSSNAGDGPCRRPHDRLLHGRRKTRRDGLTLTTSHVFWPNEPRSATSLLPFSQPNPNFLKSNCNERAKGGRAESGGRGHRKCRIDKLIRKIYSKWAPAPLYCSKKHFGAHSRPVLYRPCFYEFAVNYR